jgi:hypothetical protein
MIEIDNNLILMDKYEEPTINPKDIHSIVNISPITPNSHIEVEYFRLPDVSRESCDSKILLAGYRDAGLFVNSQIVNGKTVGVHCNNGYQRSIPFLAWYLGEYRNIPIEETVEKIRKEFMYEREYVEKVKTILKNI